MNEDGQVILTTEEGTKQLNQLVELGIERHAEYACYVISCVPEDQRSDAVFQDVIELIEGLVAANIVDRSVLATVQTQ